MNWACDQREFAYYSHSNKSVGEHFEDDRHRRTARLADSVLLVSVQHDGRGSVKYDVCVHLKKKINLKNIKKIFKIKQLLVSIYSYYTILFYSTY